MPALAPDQTKKKPEDLTEEGLPPPLPTAGSPMAATASVAPTPNGGGDHRAQPTNFTNFSRRFNANADVSKQQAGKYAAQATGAAGKAAASLGAAQQKFATGVNTGSVAPPPGSSAPAATNTGGAVPPPAAPPPPLTGKPLEDALNPQPGAGGASNVPVGNSQALSGESTRPGTNQQGLTGESTKTGATSIADMLAKAGQSYTGPQGLDTETAAVDANAAQGQLDALKDPNGIQALVNDSGQSGTRGSDALSGALIGSAGRQDFDALRGRFNPNKDLNDAQDKAIKQAKDAKEQSEKNAEGWKGAAGEAQAGKDRLDAANTANDARVKSEAEARDKRMPDKGYQEQFGGQDTEENRQAYMMNGVDKGDARAVAKRQAEIANYYGAQKMTTQQQMDTTFADFNTAFSPSAGIATLSGNQDQTQNAAKNQYGFLSVDGGGKAAAQHVPWDKAGVDGFFVWRQMSPSDWQEISGKPASGPNGQLAWIQEKARRLRAAQSPSTTTGSAGTSRSA